MLSFANVNKIAVFVTSLKKQMLCSSHCTQLDYRTNNTPNFFIKIGQCLLAKVGFTGIKIITIVTNKKIDR